MNDLYELDLFGTLTLKDGATRVMRVPGGWIFYYGAAGTFVPLDTDIITMADENCEFIESTFGCPTGDDYELYNQNAEICGKPLMTKS